MNGVIKELRFQRNVLVALVALLIVACVALTVKGDFLQIRYVGSMSSNKYHRESCEYAERIYEPYKVYYYSARAAEADGREPCVLCRPGEYK